MRITLTEEARKIVIPLFIQNAPHKAQEIIYTSPGEMLAWMQTLDDKCTLLTKKVGKWQGIAAGIAIGAGFYIWKSCKLSDEVNALKEYSEELKEELNERES